MGNKEIGFLNILKVFLTSLFIQSSFSYEKRQLKGLEFVLRCFRRKGEEIGDKKEFNTNPYLFPAFFGLLLRKEEGLFSYPQVLAAFGDEFFWRLTLPSLTLLSVSCHFLFLPRGDLFPLFVFLLPYNLITSFVRIFGFYYSYKKGGAGVFSLVKIMKETGKVLEGLIVVLIGFTFFSFLLLPCVWLPFIISFALSLLLIHLSPRFTPEKVLFLLFLVFILRVLL